MKTLNFWTITDENGDVAIADTDMLQSCAERVNVTALTEDEITATFGDRAVKREVVLKPNSHKLKHEITRHMLVKDDKTGGERSDPDLEQAARAAACVESWNLVTAEGKDAPVSVEGFGDLPYSIAEYLDAHICLHLVPQLTRSRDFLGALLRKSQPTEAK